MAEVRLERVSKTYGDYVAARDVDLVIGAGELVTLLGQSGCGKTTCLRMVAGFVTPSAGRILMGGRDVTRLAPHRRNTAMVFQSYALFPHHTVAANVAFGLKVRRLPRPEVERRTREALRLVHLEGLADRYPAQLSGGQRQRVALARAVVIEPDVLLLDEPLAALDVKLREELQVEIRRIQRSLAMTALFVTHDQGEALRLSDRVAVMRDGRVLQIGTPSAVYERPVSAFVANFVGRTNLVAVEVAERDGAGGAVLVDTGDPARRYTVGAGGGDVAIGQRCLLAVRPEYCTIGEGRANRLAATVTDVAYWGNGSTVDLKGPAGEALSVALRPGDPIPPPGATVPVGWRAEDCFLLPPA